MSSGRVDVGVIWCSNQRTKKANGWAFPPNVAKHLQHLTEGKRVGHLFGGMATWGTRLDNIHECAEPIRAKND